MVGHSDGSRRAWLPQGSGDVDVGTGGTIGDFSQFVPYGRLKRGTLNVHGEIELRAFAFEIFLKLDDSLTVGLIVNNPVRRHVQPKLNGCKTPAGGCQSQGTKRRIHD